MTNVYVLTPLYILLQQPGLHFYNMSTNVIVQNTLSELNLNHTFTYITLSCLLITVHLRYLSLSLENLLSAKYEDAQNFLESPEFVQLFVVLGESSDLIESDALDKQGLSLS